VLGEDEPTVDDHIELPATPGL